MTSGFIGLEDLDFTGDSMKKCLMLFFLVSSAHASGGGQYQQCPPGYYLSQSVGYYGNIQVSCIQRPVPVIQFQIPGFYRGNDERWGERRYDHERNERRERD